MAQAVASIVEEWASGRITTGAISLPKIALYLRKTFDTRTHFTSVQYHLKTHTPELWAKLERHRHGD